MRFVFYKKTLSKLLTALIISFIISIILLKSKVYFLFSISFFGALYILIGWLIYLKSDGIKFYKNKSFNKINTFFNSLDRFNYKDKGLYHIDKFEDIPLDKESERAMVKISIYSYIFTGIILLIIPQIYSYFFSI